VNISFPIKLNFLFFSESAWAILKSIYKQCAETTESCKLSKQK